MASPSRAPNQNNFETMPNRVEVTGLRRCQSQTTDIGGHGLHMRRAPGPGDPIHLTHRGPDDSGAPGNGWRSGFDRGRDQASAACFAISAKAVLICPSADFPSMLMAP